MSYQSTVGAGLIVAGCVQLIYATVAAVAAFGVAAFDLGAMGLQAVASISHDGRSSEITGTENGARFANLAMDVSLAGFALACVAIVAGVLILRNRHQAVFVMAVVALLSLWMMYLHATISWFVVSAMYLTLAIASVGWLIASQHPQARHRLRLASETNGANHEPRAKPDTRNAGD